MLLGITHTQKLKGTGYLDSFQETKKHPVLSQKADLCNNMFLVQQRGQRNRVSLAIFDFSNIFIYNVITCKRTLMTQKYTAREVSRLLHSVKILGI